MLPPKYRQRPGKLLFSGFKTAARRERLVDQTRIATPFELMAKSAVLNLNFPGLEGLQVQIKSLLEQASENFTKLRHSTSTQTTKQEAGENLKKFIPQINALVKRLLEDERTQLLQDVPGRDMKRDLPTDMLNWQNLTALVMQSALNEFNSLLAKCLSRVEKAANIEFASDPFNPSPKRPKLG